MDRLGESLVKLVEKETEKLVCIVGMRILELFIGVLHGKANHVLPEGSCLFAAARGCPHELEQMHVGLNHLVRGTLLLQNGNMLVLDKEYSKVDVVADCLENGITVTGVTYICKTTDPLGILLSLLALWAWSFGRALRDRGLRHNGTYILGRDAVHFFWPLSTGVKA
jgi:hypothetical protein